MKISAIVPAYNNQATLNKALSTLLNQTTPLHEIIVVDDGSEPHLHVPNGVKLIRIERQPSYRGSSDAKNVGAAAATGDWLAFTDDDIFHMPDATECVARRLEEIGRDDVLITIFSLGVPDGLLERCEWESGDSASMERLLTLFRKQNKLFKVDESAADAVIGSRSAGQIAGLVYDINKALLVSSEQHFGVISKRFFDEIGRYDAETFKDWGLNNQDLCLRVMKNGGWIYSNVTRAGGEVLHCFHSRVSDHDPTEAKAVFISKYNERFSPLMLIEAGRTCIRK